MYMHTKAHLNTYFYDFYTPEISPARQLRNIKEYFITTAYTESVMTYGKMETKILASGSMLGIASVQ